MDSLQENRYLTKKATDPADNPKELDASDEINETSEEEGENDPNTQHVYCLNTELFHGYIERVVKPNNNLPLAVKNRIFVMQDTLTQLAQNEVRMINQAELNHFNWEQGNNQGPLHVDVVPDDWGTATLTAIRQHFGARYVVLNMANSHSPGSSYTEGAVSQEDNMFRRTNCVSSSLSDDLGRDKNGYFIEDEQGRRQYNDKTALLIQGTTGEVYLDTDHPRVCFKSGELDEYKMLPETSYFLFYEMRCQGLDLRQPQNQALSKEERKKILTLKINSMLDTAIKKGQRFLVLSAHSCGTFRVDPQEVAPIFREAIKARKDHFIHIVFAIFVGDANKKQDGKTAQFLSQSEVNLNIFTEEMEKLNREINNDSSPFPHSSSASLSISSSISTSSVSTTSTTENNPVDLNLIHSFFSQQKPPIQMKTLDWHTPFMEEKPIPQITFESEEIAKRVIKTCFTSNHGYKYVKTGGLFAAEVIRFHNQNEWNVFLGVCRYIKSTPQD